MICPLRDIGASIDLQESEVAPREGETVREALDRLVACPGAACAWWVPGAEMCAMRALGTQAATIRLELDAKIARYEETH